ncbi:sporulation protein YhbH [Aneurinibacillus sp. Ricciae_BoGa-3]|uniref:sporulation protein YhbH n=1 Tax=Aneurinibacillus sp. Ricciae_BoGa-3 TaxID=3022697 RepID=UPI0023417E2C|nr:sporulation protein YhbH [Aneurinibacillus sp. Ricciae_BoGa-3]WCK55378.1 sporulation protein YhbH [Aneurinibacillus sp. Ricciae_BoGa-3]
MEDRPLYIISREDWSLHRKGNQDQLRHQEKVKEAIKKNLPDLVSEENIILSNGRDVVKIPIRSLDEYRFRYNYNKNQHVGQGNGKSKVGDVVARDGEPTDGPGKGQGAGDAPGDDFYEAEITVEELEEMLFAEMELPNLQQKDNDEIIVTDIRFNDIRKKGLMGNIDKKRTLLEALRRNGLNGTHKWTISNEDLRFKTWEEIVKPHSNAVIIAMMDTSGSMGALEKYVARSFFFWMTRFLRTRYEKVEIVFIAHHTEAKEVTEDAFFSKGESGGTICSSAYRKALEIIGERYNPVMYNIYPFHFSDGDNLTSDNERCVKLVKELMAVSNMFGYGEVNQYNSSGSIRKSTLMSVFEKISDPKFKYCIVSEKKEVYKALRTFFRKEA